jgi:hypothetical protein
VSFEELIAIAMIAEKPINPSKNFMKLGTFLIELDEPTLVFCHLVCVCDRAL